MQADTRISETGQCISHGKQSVVAGTVDTGHHTSFDSCFPGARQHRLEVVAERFVIQMAVGIDQHDLQS